MKKVNKFFGILALCLMYPLCSFAQHPVYKIYTEADREGAAIGVYNNGMNYLINTCLGDQARYLWTDADGNLLNAESDYAGSCRGYRYDGNHYIKAESTGSAPDRDIQLTKLLRDSTVVWAKTYPLDLDNTGQFVIPTKDGGFLVAGATQVPNDTLYKIQLIKTDADGNFVWQNIVTQGLVYSRVRRPNPNGCYDIINGKVITITNAGQTGDGGFFLQYLTDDPSFDCAFGGGDGGVIIRLDATGHYLWHLAEAGGASAAVRYKVAPFENGNLVVLKGMVNGDVRFCRSEAYELIKYNKTGAALWTFRRSGSTCSPIPGQSANAFAFFPNGDIALESQGMTIFRRINSETGVQIDSFQVAPHGNYLFATSMATLGNDTTFVITGAVSEPTVWRPFFYKNNFSRKSVLPNLSIEGPNIYDRRSYPNTALNVFVQGSELGGNNSSMFIVSGVISGSKLPPSLPTAIHAYISTDSTIDVGDYLFCQKTETIVPNIGPDFYFQEGAGVSIGTGRIPANFPTGDYYLLTKIDAGNTTEESKERDNLSIQPVKIIALPVSGVDNGVVSPVLQSVYPSPAGENLFISLESAVEGMAPFRFISPTGQTMLQEERHLKKGLNQVQFDVSGLAPGVYFVETTAGTGRFLKL